MTSPGHGFEIAEGYLEITADDDKAQRSILRFFRDTDLKFAALEAAMAKHGQEGGEEFGEGVTKGARAELAGGFFRDIDGRLRDAKGRFARAGDEAGRAFGGGFRRRVSRDVDADGGLFRAIGRGLSNLGDMFSSAFSRLGDFGSRLGDVGSKLGDFGGKVGDAASALLGFAKVGLIAAAIPAILGLGGALLDLIPLLLLLPTLIGGLIATLAPLIIAFQGVGAAISAIASGDIQKLNEALKALSPSARAVVKDFAKLWPILKGIQRDVQWAFFAPLVGGIKQLATLFLPALGKGLVSVASALGTLVRGFLDLLSSAGVVKTISALFKSVDRNLTAITPALLRFVGVMFTVMEKGLPFIERMFDAIAGGLDRFTNFLNKAIQSGDFNKWIEEAISTLKDLWGLTKAIGSLIGALFGDAGDEGRTFIQSLTVAVQKLADFFRTAKGKESLQTLLDTLKSIGVAVVAAGVAFANIIRWFQAFANAVESVVRWVRDAWHWLGRLWDSIVDGAQAAGHWIADVGHWFAELGSSIWGFIRSAGAAIVGWVESVVEFFRALPGRIWAGLQALPGIISSIGQAAFDAFFRAIGYISATVAMFVLDIPNKISAMWEMIKTKTVEGVSAVGRWFSELPLKAEIWFSQLWSTVTTWVSNTYHSVVNWLSGIGPAIGRWFSDAWSRAKSATSEGANSVIAYVKNIPNRIGQALSGAGSWLYQTGRDIIHGLINGISSAIGAAINAVKRAVSDIIDGAKRAVGAHSPSTKFRDEVGRWIPPGIAEGIKGQMPALIRYVGSAMDSLVLAAERHQSINVSAPSVAVGGPQVAVYVDSEEVASRLYVDPAKAAAKTAEGTRRRSYLNTGRTVMAT
jgi:phage-related protein